MRHFQAMLRIDTTDPPGGEKPAADYLKQVLEAEGIPVQIFALPTQHRPNVVARLTGTGTQAAAAADGAHRHGQRRPGKWTFPPFSATRDGGYVYGRGTVDDKDNVVAVADDDADAEAPERAARPRRDLPGRGRRGGHDEGRHPVHGRRALRRDRRRVLPRRGRQRHAHRRRRSSSPRCRRWRRSRARSSVDGARRRRPRLGAARDERRRAPGEGRRRRSRTGRRRCASTRPRARTSSGSPTISPPEEAAALPRRARPGDGSGPGRRVLPRARAAPLRRCCARRCRPPSSTRRLPHQRHSVGGTATIDTRVRCRTRTSRQFLDLVREVVNDPAVEVELGARDTRPPGARAAARLRRLQGARGQHHASTTTPSPCRR